MARILLIETATLVCSAALAEDGDVLACQDTHGSGYVHSELLTVQIETLFRSHGSALDAVAVSNGPGSYTGLRIGLSVAKGICYAKRLPLITIGSHAALAGHFLMRHEVPADAILCPMIDARRMEAYVHLFDPKLAPLTEPWAEVIHRGSFADMYPDRPMVAFGDGADKCLGAVARPGFSVVKDFRASAAGMAQVAQGHFNRNGFADLAYSTPFYLKDFRAG